MDSTANSILCACGNIGLCMVLSEQDGVAIDPDGIWRKQYFKRYSLDIDKILCASCFKPLYFSNILENKKQEYIIWEGGYWRHDLYEDEIRDILKKYNVI